MPTILDDIVANKRIELEARKNQIPPAQILQAATPSVGPSLYEALSPRDAIGSRFIFEIKPASPSGGTLNTALDFSPVVRVYSQLGAGISVLTDSKYFSGSLNLLETVVSQTTLPVLCKDFVVDPYQILEARLRGAQAILLIVKILDDALLAQLAQTAALWRMDAVVEVQNAEELTRALNIAPKIILINNRNLSDFTIDFTTSQLLAPQIGSAIRVVSASGIKHPDDIKQLRPFCNNFLIGSSLMAIPPANLSQRIEELTHAGGH